MTPIKTFFIVAAICGSNCFTLEWFSDYHDETIRADWHCDSVQFNYYQIGDTIK